MFNLIFDRKALSKLNANVDTVRDLSSAVSVDALRSIVSEKFPTPVKDQATDIVDSFADGMISAKEVMDKLENLAMSDSGKTAGLSLRKAVTTLKEKLDKSKTVTEGPHGDINVKPKSAEMPAGQKAEKGTDFIEAGEKEKLIYPKVTKEASKMEKSAAQQLPGSEKIDAGGKQFIDGGEASKLNFPTKPGPDPKVKMQGLDASSEAKKCIDGGEKGKIQHGGGKGKDIRIEWNVNVDNAVASKFSEKGDKGDIKKVTSPAKEPGISAQKEAGADAFIEKGEAPKPFQKQFSINFHKSSAAERRAAAEEAVADAALSLEIAASKCGVNIWDTPLANAYGNLLIAKAGMSTHGEIFLSAGKEQEASRESLKAKYAGDMSKCMEDQKGNVDNPAAFCKWVEGTEAPKTASLKVQASAVDTDPDGLKSAAEIGSKIF